MNIYKFFYAAYKIIAVLFLCIPFFTANAGSLNEHQENIDIINKEFQEISVNFKESEKESYIILLNDAFEFFDIIAENEQVLSAANNIHNVFSIMHMQERQREWFLNELKLFEKAGLRKSQENFFKVNVNMKNIYNRLIEHRQKLSQESEKEEIYVRVYITKENIERTQKKFLIFRESLASFGVLRYSDTLTDDWKLWITKIRIKQLKELFDVL